MPPEIPAAPAVDVRRRACVGVRPRAAEPNPVPLKLVEPAPKFRIAEDPDIVRVRPGGPEVDLEASLVRGLEPIPAPGAENGEEATEPEAETKPERNAESQAFRRTAMAELTALAGDSDDLTPRRRR